MKKNIALIAITAAALLAVPAITRAQDTATNSSAATAPAHKKHGLPFHGKIAAIDATASTVTVGTQTYTITSETKITKNGQPATLADFTVGDSVGGAYKKDGDKLNATVFHSGKKKTQPQQ